ncbi:UNVERIFIED_CONTAM: hypothetical protein Sradi_1299000 [Sesamum radiatum]|uniref:Uncharacterized protein n=1 Tax=Sesamum radiatum TaxID=300843 RepID=A0AAW2UND7_SESRA
MAVSRNVGELERPRMASILGVSLVLKHDKYLSLPFIVGRSRGELFQGIKDQIWSRIQGWKAKLLSQAVYLGPKTLWFRGIAGGSGLRKECVSGGISGFRDQRGSKSTQRLEYYQLMHELLIL